MPVRLAAAIGPAVVNISTRLDALEGGGRAAGTGMIVSRTGEIVTNKPQAACSPNPHSGTPATTGSSR